MEKKTVVGVVVRAGVIVGLVLGFLLLPLLVIEAQGLEIWCGGWTANAQNIDSTFGIGACFRLLERINTDGNGQTHVAIRSDMQSLDEEVSIIMSVLVAMIGASDLISLGGMSRLGGKVASQFMYVLASFFRLIGVVLGWTALNLVATWRKTSRDTDAYTGTESSLGSGTILLTLLALVSFCFPSWYGDPRF